MSKKKTKTHLPTGKKVAKDPYKKNPSLIGVITAEELLKMGRGPAPTQSGCGFHKSSTKKTRAVNNKNAIKDSKE